jgi:hypothetical protein
MHVQVQVYTTTADPVLKLDRTVPVPADIRNKTVLPKKIYLIFKANDKYLPI